MRTTVSALCLAVLLAGCGDKSADSVLKGEILEKMQSPDGRVAATSTRETSEKNAPPRYRVYVQRSQNPAQAVEVLDVDHSSAPVLRWVGPNGLQLIVECGQIARFANFADVWSSGEDKAKAEQVVVLLDNRGICPAGGEPPPPTSDR